VEEEYDVGGRRRSWLGTAVSGLLVLAALAVTVLRLLGIERGPAVYAVALTPWFLLVALLGVLIAIPSRARGIAVVGTAVVALQVWWLVPLFTSEADGRGADLVVATSNLKFGEGDAGAVVEMVRDEDVDLLALEELTPQAVRALRAAGLDDLLPYYAVDAQPGVQGTGVWSTSPLTAEPVEGLTSSAWKATTRGVTFVAAHPVAPGVRDPSVWQAEQDRLERVLRRIEGPAVLLGDLNATRDHAAVRAYEALGFVDAPDSAGAGILFTFPQGRTPFPVAAIDHVMARGPVPVSVSTVVIPGADHRALIVGLSLD